MNSVSFEILSLLKTFLAQKIGLRELNLKTYTPGKRIKSAIKIALCQNLTSWLQSIILSFKHTQVKSILPTSPIV